MEQHDNWHQISSVGTEAPPYGTDLDAYFNSFPPGFRFKPTDLVLVQEYQNKKLWNQPLPPNRIHEVDIYKFSPQELSVRFELLKDREEEWYFFTPRERKYKNGSRPARSAVNGYWKPTGVKVKVIDEQGKEIGERRSLEFWEGSQPNGKKTSWKMHEYEVPSPSRRRTRHDMLLDECILVKIYNSAKDKNNEVGAVGLAEDQQQNSIPNEHHSTHSVSVLPSNQLPLPRLDQPPPANELLYLITGNQDMHGGGYADVATSSLEFESASSLDYESAMKEGQNQCSSTNQQHSSFFECAFDEEELADFGSVALAPYTASPPLDDLSSIVFSSNVVSRQSDNSMAETGKEESV